MEDIKAAIGLIRQHARQLVRELDVVRGVYLDTGYTFSQCHVLFELATHGSLTLMGLADNLLIDKSNTSRTVKKLIDMGLVKSRKGPVDQRQKLFSLTAKGEKALKATTGLADHQVLGALEFLTVPQRGQVIEGIRLYADALRKSRLQAEFAISPIEQPDNGPVAELIREVMTEFNAVGDGYSIDDPEVDDMFGNYQGDRSIYYVVRRDKKIVGCGGIAPLRGGNRRTCELRKMFLRPPSRGIGVGRRLLAQLLDDARELGYTTCYLETLSRMDRANELYQKSGFEPLEKPLGNTGHGSCDRWYRLRL